MNKAKGDSWVRNPDGSYGYRLNPVKGKCPVACPYCYARGMYDSFGWNPEVRFECKELIQPMKSREPTTFWIGSTIELFGDWIEPDWMKQIFDTINAFPHHRFMFLTKLPKNLIEYSPFPDNCWVGVTVDECQQLQKALNGLQAIEAKVKFISFEPVLSDMQNPDLSTIDWVIVGACTGKKQQIFELAKLYPQLKPMVCNKKWTLQPKAEWVKQIILAGDHADIPVFVIDSLKPILGNDFPERYEIPKEI